MKKMRIEGMSCGHCTAAVEKALGEIEGVTAKVNLEEKTAYITLAGETDDEVLKKAVEDVGFDVVGIE